jgi:hypothetical protein
MTPRNSGMHLGSFIDPWHFSCISVELLVPREIHAEYITMKEIWEIPKCSATDRRNPNALQTSPLYSRNFQIEKNRSAEVYIY